MRKLLVASLLVSILAVIVCVFWLEEYRYSLPTPVPLGYKEIPLGSCVELPLKASDQKPQQRFLHFFNPDCPCSRFNAKHFTYLYQNFKDELDFTVIIPEGSSKKKTQKLLARDLKIYEDKASAWSEELGVYASPQAVLLDEQGTLYYRGNYNKARFCTLAGSNFAEISLKMMLAGQTAPDWGLEATQAFGCQLPEHGPVFNSLFSWNKQQQTPSVWKTKTMN